MNIFNKPETTRAVKSSTSALHDLQLLLAAVKELTQDYEPNAAFILQIIEHFYSNNNFVLLILLVQRHLSGTISLKRIGHLEATSYDLSA